MIEAVRAGADPNTRMNEATVLLAAVMAGRSELLRCLLTSGADVDARHFNSGSTALMYVAAMGTRVVHTVMLHALLKFGANTDIVDSAGNTALDLAVTHRNLLSAEALFAHGARCKKSSLEELKRVSREDEQRKR